jgi:hypothetical protein
LNGGVSTDVLDTDEYTGLANEKAIEGLAIPAPTVGSVVSARG